MLRWMTFSAAISDAIQARAADPILDISTQQNAALVEELAAASESMHEQADRLCNVVSAFPAT